MARLSDSDYRFVQENMPITCVDVLPYRWHHDDLQLGFIRREDHKQAEGWALVGGRVHYQETLQEAVNRHIIEIEI